MKLRSIVVLFLLVGGAAFAGQTKGQITLVTYRSFGPPPALQQYQAGPPVEYLWASASYAGTDATHIRFTATCGTQTLERESRIHYGNVATVVFPDPGAVCTVAAEAIRLIEKQEFKEAQ